MTRTYLVGDVFDRMTEIPDGSISLVACSPPFIALRSYLPADHPDKAKEIGSEPNPAAFLDTLLALTAEWGRVLAPWGSIAIELGDTFAGSGGAGGDYNKGGMRDGQNSFVGSSSFERRIDTKDTKVSNGSGSPIRDLHSKTQGGGAGWPNPKCLALIPQMYAGSLAYGRNLLTGEPSPAGQWLVRNMIVWHRPNPAVGALGDKLRPSTSYITVATRSPKRWFDLTAVRTPLAREGFTTRDRRMRTGVAQGEPLMPERVPNGSPAGAPPLDCWFDEHDVWTVTTQPSKIAHYAMWPAKLAERIVLMMCPAEVCRTCGEPRRRIEAMTRMVNGDTARARVAPTRMAGGGSVATGTRNNFSTESETLGWSDCGHGDFTPGTVLDPFAGTFTTGLVAEYHGRDAIGIDLDERNEALVPARREEVRRSLNATHVTPIDGQTELFAS